MNYRRLFIQNSMVFITLVTQNRAPLLLKNIDLLKPSFINVLKIYKFKLIAYVILPEHIHCIIKPKNISDYPKIIKSFKYSFTKKIKNINQNVDFAGSTCCKTNLAGKNDKLNKNINRENCQLTKSAHSDKIWQNRYWEHTITKEEDLYRHIDYIHYNSVKHYGIAPKDWRSSSFDKFVKMGVYNKDWCNLNDEYNINSLNLE